VVHIWQSLSRRALLRQKGTGRLLTYFCLLVCPVKDDENTQANSEKESDERVANYPTEKRCRAKNENARNHRFDYP